MNPYAVCRFQAPSAANCLSSLPSFRQAVLSPSPTPCPVSAGGSSLDGPRMLRHPFPTPSLSRSSFEEAGLVLFSQFLRTPSGHPISASGCSSQPQPSLRLEFLRLSQ